MIENIENLTETEETPPKAEPPFKNGDPKLERMADEVHQVWCNWMRHMFMQGSLMSDNGPWVMYESAKRRWARQITTPYAQLSESEKESDRNIARRYLDITIDFFLEEHHV